MRSPIRSTRLAVESLDDRIVPAAPLDLTAAGSEASAAGALLRNSDGQSSEDLHSIVRLDGRSQGKEQGYNTDARPVQFSELPAADATRAVTLGQIPAVVVNGTAYREFVLTVQEQKPALLDEVRVFLGDSGDLTGYAGMTQTLAGRTAAFDLDADGEVFVKLGEGMTLLVPESAFAGADADTYVYLYSKFGGTVGSGQPGSQPGAYEEWSVRLITPEPPPPPPPGAPSSLSGHVRFDDGSGQVSPLVNVQILLLDADGEVVAQTKTDATGAYSFTGLQVGTYTIAEGTIPFAFSYLDGPDTLGTVNGVETGEVGDDEFTVTLGSGQDGVDYDFSEMLGG